MPKRPTTRVFRACLALLAILGGSLAVPAPAAAQSCTEEPCEPIGDGQPPVISISPGSGTHTPGSLGVTLSFSDNDVLDGGSFQVLYDTVNVTSSFTFLASSTRAAQATGTITVGAGSRTLSVTLCDGTLEHSCATSTATYAGPAAAAQVTAETPSLSVPAQTRAAVRYRVTNTSSYTGSYTLGLNCPFASCAAWPATLELAAGASGWVDVGFMAPASGAGTVSLTAGSSTAGANVTAVPAPDPGFLGIRRRWSGSSGMRASS